MTSPWSTWLFLLVVYLSQTSALHCYRGQFATFTNRTTVFAGFYEVQCERKQSCARWSTSRTNVSTFYYGCARRCKDLTCCQSDLCNNQWIEEYRNATIVKIERDLIPASSKSNGKRRKMVVRRRPRRTGEGEAVVQMKVARLHLPIPTESKGESPRRGIWIILGIVGSLCLISLIASIVVFSVTTQVNMEGPRDD